MAEFGVEGQSAHAVARAQGSWMRILGGKWLNDLFEQTSAAGDTGAKALAKLDQRTYDVVRI
ncbi:hypothetical protein HNQ96_004343 [Aminobacter lissarensis]|uniref:Uncharacterized protein n=1 Tax=Aminobacter carboxidus TaxID=376165 RepID=A0A8E2BEL1_9HYPH|nr:hypothetical protein [Aminobacter lissarensis]MBB6468459.1 hypothetical protein [Aminobacter lissarensis]